MTVDLTRLRRTLKLAARFPDALAMEQFLDPRTKATPALRLLAAELDRAYTTPNSRLIISVPPQEGKTQLSRASVVRALTLNPELRVVLASYGIDLGRKHGRWIRDQIIEHADELGIRPKRGHAAVNDWSLENHDGGVLSVGVGTGLTGNPADLAIIDDPIKDAEQADSDTYRDKVWEWWTTTLQTRLAPGAPVVVILTRWHEDDLAGRLLAGEDSHRWRVINIPALAENNDQLGRQPGEPLVSARGDRDWQAIKTAVGSRTWTALYQGRPSPLAGGILQRAWFIDDGHTYSTPLAVANPDGTMRVPNPGRIITSWDMAFKDKKENDWVVGQVWMKRGIEAFLLDQVRGHWSFTESSHKVEALAAKWPQATTHLIEDKANGTAILNQLRKILPGLIPISPTESKQARASAVSPYLEAGNARFPTVTIAPWMGDFVEECAAFPNGAHDDQVDPMTQALGRLFLTGTATNFLSQLAPPCPKCATPIPRSADGVCPGCGHDTAQTAA